MYVIFMLEQAGMGAHHAGGSSACGRRWSWMPSGLPLPPLLPGHMHTSPHTRALFVSCSASAQLKKGHAEQLHVGTRDCICIQQRWPDHIHIHPLSDRCITYAEKIFNAPSHRASRDCRQCERFHAPRCIGADSPLDSALFVYARPLRIWSIVSFTECLK